MCVCERESERIGLWLGCGMAYGLYFAICFLVPPPIYLSSATPFFYSFHSLLADLFYWTTDLHRASTGDPRL